ncbi:MAG: maleylpyruvate isomerase family mycothiol-dependent enzyme [Actinobacteria bacterium]|nr:maleylpyruvate isomerase family mycothiol-dependent enzyme [Actinomycetota bacterium]MCA1719926.1 maleylpyruvate isomerase family mycothiol-dependent enzyme [Actinomycetota bacterium]
MGHLRADVDRVLVALADGNGDEVVGACPGWTLRELVEHLGGVHRWATQIVRTGSRAEQAPPPPGDLLAWFASGAEELLAVLAATPLDRPTWSLAGPATAGWWLRRQALETLVHRWDAQRAVGEPEPLDPQLAADGLAEVADVLLPRQVRLGRTPPLAQAVRLVPVDGGDPVLLGPGEPVAAVSAPAEVLLLLLWHRVDPADPRLRFHGDVRTAREVLSGALAP